MVTYDVRVMAHELHLTTPLERRINVLEMHSSFQFAGGGQRNLVTTCVYLNKHVFNVFAAAYGEGGALENDLKQNAIECIVAPHDVDRLVRFIIEKHIDIIHLNRFGGDVAFGTAFVLAGKKSNPRLIVIEKNVFGQFDPSLTSVFGASLFQSMMHVHERYVPAAHELFDFSRHKVVYNLVDNEGFEQYRVSGTQIENFRAQYGIKPDDFVIGRIGRADVSKWSDLLLDALPYAHALIPNLRCVLMGVPRSRVERIKRSPLHAYVTIIPQTSDNQTLHLLHQSFDVLAHTSKIGECNGNTINEAFFWEKPVVTHSTPDRDNGQLEQVVHMDTGLIANTPQSFARALAYLYHNPQERKRIVHNGRQFITRQYARSYIRVIEKIFVEKLCESGYALPKEIVDFYSKIAYYPSEESIRTYQDVYKKRCSTEFGKLSFFEKCHNYLRLPIKLYWKLKDFIEHRAA